MTALDVTVVVPFFGELHTRLAHERAIPSAVQHGARIVVCTGTTVGEARQHGLDAVGTEWVVHLDADDELTPGYLEAMATGTADVRAPAVEYVQPDGTPTPPNLWSAGRGDCHTGTGNHTAGCLLFGNIIPIGALVRTDVLRKVGGWHDHAWSEDWCTWLRCHLAGASFEDIPVAVYRAHVTPGSRNRSMPRHDRAVVHHEIAQENGIPTPEYIMRYLRPSPTR